MKLTIDKVLQNAIAAHKIGNTKKAENFYNTILKTQPNHAKANYNLGMIAISVNKNEKALMLFKNALIANPKMEEFWISYIYALFRLNMFQEANLVIEKYKKIGFNSKKIIEIANSIHRKNFKQNFFLVIKNFYKNISNQILLNAAPGWLFSVSFDGHYICNDEIKNNTSRKKFLDNTKQNVIQNKTANFEINPSDFFDYLNKEKNVIKKYNYIKNLIFSNDSNLSNDSFKNDIEINLEEACQKTFKVNDLNIVIIGGGVCGLFLANSIKKKYGKTTNILVLDNRSSFQNTRKTFKRNWLTHIPVDIFSKGQPSNVISLLKCFGTNGFIGVPINILETILHLSCKLQGVKFYFSKNCDYSKLNNDLSDIIFDATGGRLKQIYPSSTYLNEQTLEISKKEINIKYAGINQLDHIPNTKNDRLKITLKSNGNYYSPYINGSKIFTHMIKLSSIPSSLIPRILNKIQDINFSNLFYVWNGELKNEINEGLIIINLQIEEYESLKTIINLPKNLKSLSDSFNLEDLFNFKIALILRWLVSVDENCKIIIERPFKYDAFVNLTANLGSINGKRVFPIGDSLFCGHPKVGNGLARHLNMINELVQKMYIN